MPPKFTLHCHHTATEPIHSVPLDANCSPHLDRRGPVPHLFHSNIISLHQSDIFVDLKIKEMHSELPSDTVFQKRDIFPPKHYVINIFASSMFLSSFVQLLRIPVLYLWRLNVPCYGIGILSYTFLP